MQEAYFRYMAENPTAGLIQEEDEEEVDYDSDGNPIAPTKKMIIPLPPIDHSEVLLLYLPKVIVALTFLNRVLQGWHNCVGQPRSLHIKKLIGLFSENIFKILFLHVLCIKGILHPKIQIMSLITHPHVVPNP